MAGRTNTPRSWFNFETIFTVLVPFAAVATALLMFLFEQSIAHAPHTAESLMTASTWAFFAAIIAGSAITTVMHFRSNMNMFTIAVFVAIALVTSPYLIVFSISGFYNFASLIGAVAAIAINLPLIATLICALIEG